MLNLSKAIYAKKAGSDLNTDVGGRFYKNRAPERAAYPYVVYMIVSDAPDHVMGGREYEDILIQFSLFSSTSGSTQIETMYGHLKDLYDECSFSITGETLIWMQRENTVQQTEDHDATPSGTIEVWAYHVTYRLTVRTV